MTAVDAVPPEPAAPADHPAAAHEPAAHEPFVPGASPHEPVQEPAAHGTAVPEPFVHEGLFYRGPQEYLAGTVPFIRHGLAAGEPVLVAVPGPNLELLRAELGGQAGRVRMLDMTHAGRNPGRIIPGVLHAFVDRYAPARVRIIGEPIWAGRSAVEYPACVQHEALINAAFTGREASILCPYDAAGLDRAVLADATRTHPILIEGAVRQHSRDYAGPEPVVAAYNQPLPDPSDDVATLIFTVGGLVQVRQFVAEHARHAGLPADRRADLQIAVNEVAANTLDHTGEPGTLRIWRESASLVCEVRDSGQLTDLLVGRIPPALESERGRGLLLVNHLCDLVRIHTRPASTTVRLYLTL